MLQLIDLAVKQRETLITASLGGPKSQLLGKDFCGYDYRLDTVGVAAPFAAFVHSPAGEAVFKTGRLPLPGDEDFVSPLASESEDGGRHVNGNGNGVTGMAGLAAVMCVRRKCKPHAGWSGIHTKNVKHQIKELAAQAKERLDFEARIRDCAAVRYQRRKREKNGVEVVDHEVEMAG
jgi:COMPASS component SPP1